MAYVQSKADYAEYERNVAQFIEREKLTFISTSCDENALSEDEGGNVDSWFSKSPCECCGDHYHGNREYLFAISDGQRVRFEICEDCVYYIEYSRLDDLTMLQVGGSDERNHSSKRSNRTN